MTSLRRGDQAMSRHISRRERATGRKPGPAPTGLPTVGDAALAQAAQAAEERRRAERDAANARARGREHILLAGPGQSPRERIDDSPRVRRPGRHILGLALSVAALMPPMVQQ